MDSNVKSKVLHDNQTFPRDKALEDILKVEIYIL